MAVTINFRALQTSNEQRTAYGLRYHDFTRYRKHCANRTHRLRSTLKMTHGKGREFKKLPALNLDTAKSGNLELLLFEAERAWAYSQELLAASPDSRHHATARFRRSLHWSTQLLSVCQSLHSSARLSTLSLLEITTYTLIQNGRFHLHRYAFEDALAQLAVARALLDVLAGSATTSKAQALYVLHADAIGPEIRYCAHELGRDKAWDIDGIVQEHEDSREELVEGYAVLVQKLQGETQDEGESKGRLDELLWEDKPVPVRNPELVDVLLKVQDGQRKLTAGAKGGRKGVAAFDAVLSALSDADEIARRLSESSGQQQQSSASGSRDVHFVHAYILYQLLSKRIERDLLLVKSLISSKGKEEARVYPAIVKLLDTILQSLVQMRALSIVDDNIDLAENVEARLAWTRARRCFYLSKCYTPLQKYAESLTLLQTSSLHLRDTRAHLSNAPDAASVAFYPLSTDTVDALAQDADADALTCKRAWFAHNRGGEAGKGQKEEGPVLLNIAFQYLELPMDDVYAKAGVEPPPQQQQQQQQQAPPSPEISKKVEGNKGPVRTPKEEEEELGAVEEERQGAKSGGGLSGLLGGWWGRS